MTGTGDEREDRCKEGPSKRRSIGHGHHLDVGPGRRQRDQRRLQVSRRNDGRMESP